MLKVKYGKELLQNVVTLHDTEYDVDCPKCNKIIYSRRDSETYETQQYNKEDRGNSGIARLSCPNCNSSVSLVQSHFRIETDGSYSGKLWDSHFKCDKECGWDVHNNGEKDSEKIKHSECGTKISSNFIKGLSIEKYHIEARDYRNQKLNLNSEEYSGKNKLLDKTHNANDNKNPQNSISDTLKNSFDYIIPITVTPLELDNRLYAYMASGELSPDDMIETSTITLRERYYVPAFAFKVEYRATWTAFFGFDRQQPYTAYRNVTSNGYTRQEPYTDYQIVTDWRKANGIEAGTFNVAGYAGTRLNDAHLAPARLIAHAVIYSNPSKYNSSFVKGLEIEQFSIPESAVYESLKYEINSNIDLEVMNHAQGDRQRDWRWSARMSHNTTTYAVPICHAVFKYRDKEYEVWVGGHDVNTFYADELPVDKDKQKVANIGFLPGVIGLTTVICTTFIWSLNWMSLIATSIVLGYGFLRRNALIDYSKSVRNSLLIQMKESNQAAILSDEEQDRVANAFQRPERPFFAKTHKDKIILPSLTFFAFLGAVIPNAV